MEFKILNLNSASSSTTLLKETPLFLIQDLVQSNSILEAKVLEGLRGKNIYLIEMNGKQFKLQSETKLLKNEALKLNVNRASSQTQLEIISRSTSSLPVSSSLESVWTKNYFSPVQVLSKSFESAQSDVSVQKLVQLLDVFLPGLEWKEDTLCFDWKFADGEANGFLGKRKESFGFYFHYSSKSLEMLIRIFYGKRAIYLI